MQVITQQIGRLSLAGLPSSFCPPGLEPLAASEKLVVRQELELVEALTGFQGANHYSIFNELGQLIYHAAEQTHCLTRTCCGRYRGFNIQVVDNQRQEVLQLGRPYRCCCSALCCPQLLRVWRGQQLVGSLREDPSPCSRSYSVRSPFGVTQLKIRSRRCPCTCCCGDVQFMIRSADEKFDVGILYTQWHNLDTAPYGQEVDAIAMHYPRDLDVGMKATLLGAAFFISLMYYEHEEVNTSE